MNKGGIVVGFLAACSLCGDLSSMQIGEDVAIRLGEKIWKNECHGSVEGLTHWNRGENFGSFGIGHFIWYPMDHQEHFKETFPDLLKYLQLKGVVLPDWLRHAQGCPWRSREEFVANLHTPQMVSLRQILLETKDLQALFIVERFEKATQEMTAGLSPEDKGKVAKVIAKLSKDFRGLYAMIDYLNFKGMGCQPLETYRGQGWGLLQVLQRISPDSDHLLLDFSNQAKAVLKQRVENAPKDRHEERWLHGWLNRIDTYK